MPGTISEAPPSVSLSFANNFWGKEDAGVSPLLERMLSAKSTSDELKAFYTARAAIEEEYARKILNLSRKPLGSSEAGTLRLSLDVVKAEMEAVGKAHQNVAQQMKTELDEQLAAFAGAMKERRKIVQGGIEKLLKVKTQQTIVVNKARDRYEQDCLKIKGYLAQGHMVMGQEERKNKAKLEKTQLQLSTTNNEYEQAVKILEETTGRWNREWKAACDKFQDLEEERIDFTKSSLWSFANIASTVCVSDDASCEKIRLSLEDCDVEKDITTFIKECGTGQEIPDAPKYVNFCRGDINDAASDVSADGDYSVAQFQRTMNPAFRTSSPQPSIFESHHDPDSELAHEYRREDSMNRSDLSATTTPKKTAPAQQFTSRPSSRQQGPKLVHREGYPEVPHNEYPMDGMTQFCRLEQPSEVSSAASPIRPLSRDSQSEYSNPTSLSSVGPDYALSRSPTKQMSDLSISESAHQIAKKRSGFFQNRSPFRRKSKSEKENPRKSTAPAIRNAWGPPSNTATSKSYGQATRNLNLSERPSASPEPVDPRANFQLNVGGNVFDVASPDKRRSPQKIATANADESDPLVQALAELKGLNKNASVRVSADRYHGLATPAPGAAPARGQPQKITDRNAPPPSYEAPPVSRLGAPQPAFTSRQMQQTTQRYTNQKDNMFGPPSRQNNSDQENNSTRTTPQSRPGTQGGPTSRATSPSPYRSTSPRPGMYHEQGRAFPPPRAASPNLAINQGQNRARAQSTSPIKQRQPPAGYIGRAASPVGMPRATSPHPDFDRSWGSNSGEMALQLAQPPPSNGYGPPNPRGRPMSGGQQQRPTSVYGAPPPQKQQDTRARSRSQAPQPGGRQFTHDGRPILYYARALYMYQAAIPEELSFAKGDVLAVLHEQDDGWLLATIAGKRTKPGLAPSNYLDARV